MNIYAASRLVTLSRPLSLALLAAALAVPLAADDRDLLRTEGANPYLFIMLDNSASMNLRLGDGDIPTVGFSDDPASRIYQAKEALFEVFEPIDDLNFGFATFNQDHLTARFIHYPYYHEQALPATWPLDWPRPEVNGLVELEDSDGDGLPDRYMTSVQGDPVVFGEEFRNAGGGLIPGGTCGSPLDLDQAEGRGRANTFGKLGTFGTVPTTMWIESVGADGVGKKVTYHLTIVRLAGVPGGNGLPSTPPLRVRFELRPLKGKCSDFSSADPPSATLTLDLLLDPQMPRFLMNDFGPGGGNGEESPGYWPWTDVVGASVCGGDRPHTGLGWEGNYDGSGFNPGSGFDDPVDRDIFCFNDGGRERCIDLKYNPTVGDTSSPKWRVLDRGDLLPYDWRNDNKTAFLQRLSPSYPEGAPDFRVTPHLEADVVQANFGAYRPKIANRPPVIAAGQSPIANAVVDFQCFYKGTDAVSKNIDCSQAAFPVGWAELACREDPKYGCRRPFFVLITDGGHHCDGNNPRSDINRLFRDAGVRFWLLNLGDPDNCTSGNLKAWLNTPGGEEPGLCVTVQSKQDLVNALLDIVGEIQDSPRAFASAAVPTVQANARQSIYLSSFIPFKDASTWSGHLDAFLKPVPLAADGTPDTTHPNHLWDAAEVMKNDQVDPAQPVGHNSGRRRVFYSTESTSGQWPNARRLLATSDADPDPIRYDLWRGLGLVGSGVPDGSLSDSQETLMQARGEVVVKRTLALKSATRSDGTVVDYILGDTFHSDPVVIGTPSNARYFALDLGSGQDEPCRADDSAANSNRGYRCYFLRNLFRRRVLLSGVNDGMLHAFNIGQTNNSGEVDDGSGHEVWAYVPRQVLPTVRRISESSSHRYSVDGRVGAADVFIDPLHMGTPDADERLWRTVAIGSLREGGAGYFALDVTQPEKLRKVDTDPTFFGDERFYPDGAFTPQVAGCSQGGAGCGPVPYPAPLWEFNDTTEDSLLTGLAPAIAVPLDEDDLNGDGLPDGNGQPDLGDSWGRANIGAIQICAASAANCADPASFETRFVAVFGGGMDPLNKNFNPADPLQVASHSLRGNYLFMVDVETGKVIYKRQLLGAVPGEASLLDADQNGLIDRIYIGTLSGLMYRVDLGPVGGELPKLQPTTTLDLNGDSYDALRITVSATGKLMWEPEVIFNANFDGSIPLTEPRAIYHRPSVVFVASLGKYALAFGTGDREDLWSQGTIEERFYLFVDDSDEVAKGDPNAFPLREAFYTPVDLDDLNDVDNTNLLLGATGRRGWFLRLGAEERVTSDSFSLSGVTFFSAFRPRVDLETEDGTSITFDPDTQCGDPNFEENTSNECTSRGSSAVFIVNTTNANGFIPDGAGFDRFKLISDVFVSNPFLESAQNKNPRPPSGGGNEPPPPAPGEPPTVPVDLFPENCKFANYAEDIRVVTSETKLQSIARVPVCIIEKNWKEY